MTTRTMSLIDLARRCLTKATSLPAGDQYLSARKRLYEAAERFRADYDFLMGYDDDEGEIGCQVDQSWL